MTLRQTKRSVAERGVALKSRISIAGLEGWKVMWLGSCRGVC